MIKNIKQIPYLLWLGIEMSKLGTNKLIVDGKCTMLYIHSCFYLLKHFIAAEAVIVTLDV